jgi:hypothetical protein
MHSIGYKIDTNQEKRKNPRAEEIFEKIMVKIFPKLMKQSSNPYKFKVMKIENKINIKKTAPGNIIVFSANRKTIHHSEIPVNKKA